MNGEEQATGAPDIPGYILAQAAAIIALGLRRARAAEQNSKTAKAS